MKGSTLLRALTLLLAAATAPVHAAAPATYQGDWEQGSLLIGQTAPGAKVTLGDRPLRVSPEGLFLIGLDRDAKPVASVKIKLPGAREVVEAHDVAPREWDVQPLTGIPPKFVDPPAKVQARIKAEQAKINEVRKRDTAITDFAKPFAWPALGRISGIFGSQRILNGTPKSPHYGVDVAVPTGTPIAAPTGGIVALSEPNFYYTGGTVIIDHGHGLQSILVHLSKLEVKVGQRVEQGQIVALSGATGRVTGPHLHWGLYWFGERVDAQKFTGPMPAKPAAAP